MSKWSGDLGFVIPYETKPDVWDDVPVVKQYLGDVFRSGRRFQQTDNPSDKIVVTNEISVVANNFLKQNYIYLKYCTYMGIKWKVSSVDVALPRIKLTLGDVYNG